VEKDLALFVNTAMSRTLKSVGVSGYHRYMVQV